MKHYLIDVINRILLDLKTFWVGILLFLIYYPTCLFFFHASCPALLITGFPCPGCGMTRAVKCILTGKWESAFYINPVSFLVVVALIALIVFRYFIGKMPKFIYVILWIIGILMIARYIYGLIFWFPDRIPYVYRHHNLIHWITNRH